MMVTLSKSGEAHNTDESKCLLTQTRRPTKKSSSSSNYIDSLPADVIFEILVRVPVQDICSSARLVCRKWHKMIHTRDFKHAHHSTCGLIAYDVDHESCCIRPFDHLMTFIVDTKAAAADDDHLIEISKLKFRSHQYVLSSCNGLVLASLSFYNRELYITNPATRQKLDLPRFSSKIKVCGCAIEHVAATMEYKVVCGFSTPDDDDCVGGVAIMTAGVDKDWSRRVNTQHLSKQAKMLLSKDYHPLTTPGFVHWDQSEYVLTLNVETEIITQFPVPCLLCLGVHTKEVIYLPMGSYLSLLVSLSQFSWELWEMKPETGEWTQMPSIDLQQETGEWNQLPSIDLQQETGEWTQMPSIDLQQEEAGRSFVKNNQTIKPVGWLRPREVLVFHFENIDWDPFNNFYYPCPQVGFAYNVRTRKFQELVLDAGITYIYLAHKNSLALIN